VSRVTAHGIPIQRPQAGSIDPLRDRPAERAVSLGPVREDIRQTLRTAWIDPALECAASHPLFLTMGWSAIRPNIGRSFLVQARALRAQAVEGVGVPKPTAVGELRREFPEDEVRRIQDAVRAALLVSSKVQIVVHALHRAARKERIPGTGREEPPVRRGVPEWQRWMSFQASSGNADHHAHDAMELLSLPSPPASLRLLSRWPAAAAALLDRLREHSGTEAWTSACRRLRRTTMTGITTLPHPIELQWTAMHARGFGEQDRARLVDVLEAHDASMPAQTLVAAVAWQTLGTPEIGPER
jgi:hypothetical protein